MSTAEQLVLGLAQPWDGTSPRYLTKGFALFRLAPEGTSWPALSDLTPTVETDPQDPLQLELFDGASSIRCP